MKKGGLIVGVIIVAGVAFGAWKLLSHGGADAAGGNAMGGGGPTPVTIAAVLQKEVQESQEFSGRLEAVDQVDIRPRVGGTIDAIRFEEGAMVKKGDLLFNIDPQPYIADVARADGVYQAAVAQSALAQTELARSTRLWEAKAIAKREFDEKVSAQKSYKAAEATAAAQLRVAKLNLSYTDIRSPINGRVSRAEITLGNLVEAGPNAPVLTRVVSSSPIYASFEVDEPTFLRYVRTQAMEKDNAKKLPVKLALSGETEPKITGTIHSFDNQLDSASGTIRVRAVFDNADGSLVPGLFSRVMLGSGDVQNSLLITDRAVGTDQSRKFVYVVDADGKAQYRPVQLGGVVDGLRIVKDGLKPGEKIVINGTAKIFAPGTPVKGPEVPMDATPEQIAAANAPQEAAPAAGAATKEEKK